MENLTFNLVEKDTIPKEIPLPNKEAVGHQRVDNKIGVFTEWAPVKSLILGYMGESSNIPIEDEILMLDENEIIPGIEFPKDVIKRAQEIQNNVATELMKRGINVLRVGEIDCKKEYKIGDKMIAGFHTFSSRDIIFFYHDIAIEIPSITISRQNEHPSFYWIMKQLFEKGSKWFTSWKCPYSKEAPLFEAANIIRAGLDILFQISVSANFSGYKLFRKFMEERYGGKVRVHPIYVYDGVHIDTTLTILGFNKKIKKFIVLANPERVSPSNIPALFRGKNWAVLYGPTPIDQGFVKDLCMSSVWISLNIFVVNPHLILMDDSQPELVKYFNHYEIDTIQVKHELGRTVCGSMHCMTNEFNREEDFDFEKVLSKPKDKLLKEEDACFFDPDHLELFRKESQEYADWVDIANKNSIFPSILTDHLDDDGKKELHKILDKIPK